MHNTVTSEQMKDLIINQAQKEGITLSIDKENEKVFNLLCQYWARDIAFEKEGFSLNKGLMLFGNTGCGKTVLSKLFIHNPFIRYVVINCRKVASIFAIGGDEAILPYCDKRSYMGDGGRPGTLVNKFDLQAHCFDDLGAEPLKQYFGQKIEVMEEVILRRYDVGAPFYKTHVTTNLTAKLLRDRYGDRFADRCIEMFNVIQFPKEAESRRK